MQEVASWLLEMNQDLLSGGSGSRAAQQQRPGAGNSTSGRTPQPQAEHVNQVLEEQEQEVQQQRRDPGEEEEGRRPREGEEEPWPSGGEPLEEGRRSEVNGAEKGAQWMWEQEQQRRRRRRHRDEEEENDEEDNNNGGRDGQVGSGLRPEEDDDRPEDEENGEEEDMDQDSDEFEFEHSEDSGREEEEEAEEEEEGEDGLLSPSLRTSVSDPNDNTDQSSGRTHQSSTSVSKNKVSK